MMEAILFQMVKSSNCGLRTVSQAMVAVDSVCGFSKN